MRDFDENNITAAVLERMAGAGTERTRAVSEALVRHLHAFIREIEPTQAEWEAGIDFLTRTGQMCSTTRQEFILLSDSLGVSMLVDAINHRFSGNASETTVLGPFYVADPPDFPLGTDISGDLEGEPLWVEGRIFDAAGQPLAGAVVDTWHADGDGYYDVQGEGEGEIELNMRARFITDAEGRYFYRSVVPAAYPIPNDGPVGQMLDAQGRHPYRPAHVHFMVAATGHETLVTHVFLEGDRYLDSDVVFGVKTSLIAPLVPVAGQHGIAQGQRLAYDFTLAPAAG